MEVGEGGGGMEVGEEGVYIPIATLSPPEMTCRDESRFNILLIVRDKVTTRLRPQTKTFLKKKELK